MSLGNICKKSEGRTTLTLLNITEDDNIDVDSKEFVKLFVESSFESQELRQKILRFRKDTDRLLHLCSMYLKSGAYYLLSDDPPDYPNGKKHVVDLPRTRYGKPYLPSSSSDISISHQYPFVGIATSPNAIGLDIVVMEEREMHYFEGSFAPREWSKVKENISQFYLLWAIKEAYTKALGVGMSLDFASFEVRLPSDATWKNIKENKSGTQYKAEIQVENQDNQSWNVFFYPLSGYKDDACACVCSATNLKASVAWMTVTQLIEWHNRDDTANDNEKTLSFIEWIQSFLN